MTGMERDNRTGNREMARMHMAELENLEMAAPAASADTFYEMGLKYSAGKGVEADLVSAHKWFNLAALKGNRSALEYRSELAREMSSEDIHEAQRQAREWLQAH